MKFTRVLANIVTMMFPLVFTMIPILCAQWVSQCVNNDVHHVFLNRFAMNSTNMSEMMVAIRSAMMFAMMSARMFTIMFTMMSAMMVTMMFTIMFAMM